MSFTRVIVSLVTPPLPPVGRALMNRCEGHTGRTGQAMHDRSMWNGWPLFWVLTGLLMLMSAVLLARVGFDTDGYRLVIRFTAQSSLALFLVASVASAVHARWPGPFATWLGTQPACVRARLCHVACHPPLSDHHLRTDCLAELLEPVQQGSNYRGPHCVCDHRISRVDIFRRDSPKVGGKLLEATASLRHLVVWLFFVFTNGKRVPGSAWYLVPVALLIAAMAFKLRAARPRLAALTPEPARSA